MCSHRPIPFSLTGRYHGSDAQKDEIWEMVYFDHSLICERARIKVQLQI